MLVVKVPSVRNHQIKVLIVINACTDIPVVFKEFFQINLTVPAALTFV